MIDNEWLKINHQKVLDDMETILYDFMPDGTRFIVSKQDMKSREKMRLMGITSPDAGEALMMAVSQIRNIAKVSDMKRSNLPQYAIMDEGGERLMEHTRRDLPAYTTGM